MVSRDGRPHQRTHLLHFIPGATGGHNHAIGDSRGLDAFASRHLDHHGAIECRVERAVILQPLCELDDALRDPFGCRSSVAFGNAKWMEQCLLKCQLPLPHISLIAHMGETREAFAGEGECFSSGEMAGRHVRGSQEMVRSAPRVPRRLEQQCEFSSHRVFSLTVLSLERLTHFPAPDGFAGR